VTNGRVVKGVQFEHLRDVGDPVALARAYSDGGADELVFLDITATKDGRRSMVELVARVADVVAIPFTVGGGVRTLADADAFIAAGADRVSLNSAALTTPELITQIAARYGSQAVVVAIDARQQRAFSHGGTRDTGMDVLEWSREVADRGAGEILLTSMDHDGQRTGYDIDLTVAVRDVSGIPVIASGGAGSPAHVADALTHVGAALVASILHDNPAELPRLRAELLALGAPLRPIQEYT
jgi:cyclase